MRSAAHVVAIAAVALCASTTLGAEPPKAPAKGNAPPAKAVAEVPAATQGGMVAFVDPATGKLRQPTNEEIGQLLALRKPGSVGALGAAPAAPQPRLLANGITAVMLDPSFDSYSVVTKGPDGKLYMSCVDGKEKADRAVAAGAAPAAKEALDEK